MSDRPLLTAEEADRAIYIHLEGGIGRSPVLLGALWVSRRGQEPMLRQYVLDEGVASAAVATGRSATSLAGELKSMIARAQSQDRVVVGWSERELDAVEEFAPEFSDEFDPRYRDAQALARRWRKKLHPNFNAAANRSGKKHSLARYQVLADYSLRPEFPGRRAAKTIAEMQGSIERKGSYDALSAKLQARWSELLGNNEHACRATRAVCLAALDELADLDLSGARTKKSPRGGKKHGRKSEGQVA